MIKVTCLHFCFLRPNSHCTIVIYVFFVTGSSAFAYVVYSEMAYYVVFRGRQPGIYKDWAICHDQVNAVPHSCYKRFTTEGEAVEAYKRYCDGNTEACDEFDEKKTREKPGRQGKYGRKDAIIIIQFMIIIFLLYMLA